MSYGISEYAEVLVPVDLCLLAIRQRKTSRLRLYLLLKLMCSGKMEINERKIAECSIILHCSTKTIKRIIKDLTNVDWIGFNPQNLKHYIRGFNSVCKIEGINSFPAVGFGYSDFQTFDGFCFGVVLARLIKHRKLLRLAERKKGRSFHTNPNDGFSFSIRLLSKILKISESKVYRLKMRALAAGYIDIQKMQSPVNLSVSQVKWLQNECPDIACKIRRIKGKVYLLEADQISINQTLRRVKDRRTKMKQ